MAEDVRRSERLLSRQTDPQGVLGVVLAADLCSFTGGDSERTAVLRRNTAIFDCAQVVAV